MEVETNFKSEGCMDKEESYRRPFEVGILIITLNINNKIKNTYAGKKILQSLYHYRKRFETYRRTLDSSVSNSIRKRIPTETRV